MKRRQFIMGTTTAAATSIAASALTGCTFDSASPELKPGEVLHTVIFDLKHPAGSPDAERFLTDGYAILTKIPGVQNFQIFNQCSPKNDYQYCFSMRFKNQQDFEAYSANPNHVKFVTERWDAEVSRFQESDFQTRG